MRHFHCLQNWNNTSSYTVNILNNGLPWKHLLDLPLKHTHTHRLRQTHRLVQCRASKGNNMETNPGAAMTHCPAFICWWVVYWLKQAQQLIQLHKHTHTHTHTHIDIKKSEVVGNRGVFILTHFRKDRFTHFKCVSSKSLLDYKHQRLCTGF